jgi:hypothetical protein
MRRFPAEFADLLTADGLRILGEKPRGPQDPFRGRGHPPLLILRGLLDPAKAADCFQLMDRLRPFVRALRTPIPPESITEMRTNYSEQLEKTMRVKTAYFQYAHSRRSQAYREAERLGFLTMMRSTSLVAFVEAVTGYVLDHSDEGCQAICYEHGDYNGPHNDHHPELEDARDGYIDFHIMFSNEAIAHHYLVYEDHGYLTRIEDVTAPGTLAIYRLPFWHYTTPLAARAGRQAEARRWLLMRSFFFR